MNGPLIKSTIKIYLEILKGREIVINVLLMLVSINYLLIPAQIIHLQGIRKRNHINYFPSSL